MNSVDVRLQRLLGGASLAPLRMRLRQRFERQPLDEVLNHIRLDGLTVEERSAIASLTGSPAKTSKSISIDVMALDLALANAGIASSLRQALEQLDGPMVHVATARAEEARRWEEVASRCSEQRLVDWVLRPSNFGLLKRLSKSDPGRSAELCRRAEAVLNKLPARGTTRSQLGRC